MTRQKSARKAKTAILVFENEDEDYDQEDQRRGRGPSAQLLPDAAGESFAPKSTARRLPEVRNQETMDECAIEDDEPVSVIRSNLLGPLSFDDLYYV